MASKETLLKPTEIELEERAYRPNTMDTDEDETDTENHSRYMQSEFTEPNEAYNTNKVKFKPISKTAVPEDGSAQTRQKCLGLSYLVIFLLLVIIAIIVAKGVEYLHMTVPPSWIIRMGLSYQMVNTTASSCDAAYTFSCGTFDVMHYNTSAAEILSLEMKTSVGAVVAQLSQQLNNGAAYVPTTTTGAACYGYFDNGTILTVAPDQEDSLYYAVYITKSGCEGNAFTRVTDASDLQSYPTEILQVIGLESRPTLLQNCLPTIPEGVNIYYTHGCMSVTTTALSMYEQAAAQLSSISTLQRFWPGLLNAAFPTLSRGPTTNFYASVIASAVDFVQAQHWTGTSELQSVSLIENFTNAPNQDCSDGNTPTSFSECQNRWFIQQLLLLNLSTQPLLQIPVAEYQTSMTYDPLYHAVYIPRASAGMPFYQADFKEDWKWTGVGYFLLRTLATMVKTENNQTVVPVHCPLTFPDFFALNVVKEKLVTPEAWIYLSQWTCGTAAGSIWSEILTLAPNYKNLYKCGNSNTDNTLSLAACYI